MEWIQALTIIGTNAALFTVALGITITLFVHIDNKTNLLIYQMKEEMKDFHGRLCKIEESRKN